MVDTRWRFWVVTLATVLTMAVTARLGFWQLDRAGQKLALQAQIDARANLPVWQTSDVRSLTAPEEGLHRQVELTGYWVKHATVYLDNRQMNGRVGFFVLTPLRLSGSERAVLVQRGWAPRDFQDRGRVPEVPTPEDEIRIGGRLAPPPGRLYELGEAPAGVIRQNIDLAAFAQESGLALLPLSVVQSNDAPDGLLRDWPAFDVGVQKHHGYAFQWFGLCALAGFLYLWFQFISPRRQRPPHAPDA
jgi:surfeit locus 1 family protein